MGSDVSHKIMLAAIASLFVVVMITILFHLCTKYLLRRQERRRATALNLQRTQIAAFCGSSINSPKSGLDPLVLASLPMYTCKLTTGQVDNHDEPTECSGTITEESTLRLLPNCKHVFHVEYIDAWLGSHTTCPVCGTEAEPTVRATKVKELCSMVQPTAPPLMGSAPIGAAQMGKGGLGQDLVPLKGCLVGERSSRRFQSCGDEIFGAKLLDFPVPPDMPCQHPHFHPRISGLHPSSSSTNNGVVFNFGKLFWKVKKTQKSKGLENSSSLGSRRTKG
ncbi:hypothetical protein V6N13_119955 [Hibiscus sabdariffa]